jgi:hypothetical protein
LIPNEAFSAETVLSEAAYRSTADSAVFRCPPLHDCGILGIIPDSRIQVVDAVRGFAIFGILVVNVGSYFNPPVFVNCPC